MSSIMSHLPNDLILNIIREADGGKYAHETNFKDCVREINLQETFFKYDVFLNSFEEMLHTYSHVEGYDFENTTLGQVIIEDRNWWDEYCC